MKSQTGARFVARKNREVKEPSEVIVCHVKRESKLVRLASGAVRRERHA